MKKELRSKISIDIERESGIVFYQRSFLGIQNKVSKSYESAGLANMEKPSDEKQNGLPGEPTHERVRIDGTWQKHGHSSLNGVVTAVIGNSSNNNRTAVVDDK